MPIATTSVAGKVKPDGTSIKVDANGTIQDYGNTLIEQTEYLRKHNIGQFSSGWHIIKGDSSALGYSMLPLPKTRIASAGFGLLHIITGFDLGSEHSRFYDYSAEFFCCKQIANEWVPKKWILPLWDWDSTYPVASDWIEINNKTIGSLTEQTEYLHTSNIGYFSTGWHIIKGDSSTLNYSTLPLSASAIGSSFGLLHIITGHDFDGNFAQPTNYVTAFWHYSAEFIFGKRKWILPLWDWDSTAPTASDWIEVTQNTLEIEPRQSSVTHVYDFEDGWHLISKDTPGNLFNELPISSSDIGTISEHTGVAFLYVKKTSQSITGYGNLQIMTCRLIYTSDTSSAHLAPGNQWFLPCFVYKRENETASYSPTADTWIKLDRSIIETSQSEATYEGDIPVYDVSKSTMSHKFLKRSGYKVQNLLTTSNSCPVRILSSAPSDTTILWVK